MMFLSSISCQVAYVNATAFVLKMANKWQFFIRLICRRRGPEIAQYTNGQDQVIEQRTWFLLPLLTPLETLRACVGSSSLMPKTNSTEVVWWAKYCNDMRSFDYPVSRCVRSCVLDKPVIFATSSLTHFKFRGVGYRLWGSWYGVLAFFSVAVAHPIYYLRSLVALFL